MKVGDILKPKNLEEDWEVVAIVGDAVCLQSEKPDNWGNIFSLFWMRKSELESSDKIDG